MNQQNMQAPSQSQPHTPPPIHIGMMQQPGQQMVMSLPSTNATAALVLSIIGILSIWMYGLGICFAIPALILANGSLQITKQFPNHPDAGVAKAAMICAWVAIVLVIAIFGLVVLAGVLYVWSSSL